MRIKLRDVEDDVRNRNLLGETRQQIADAHGVDIKTLHNWYKKLGLKSLHTKSREKCYNWNGGTFVNGGGYRMILLPSEDPFYSMTNWNGYIPEHRLVMSRHLSRPLERHETVHHVDGDKLNNEISNLQLRHGPHGKGVIYRCALCGSNDVKAVKIG